MKEIILHCPQAVIELLYKAMHAYAHAAYPPGGSECAQSAREAILTSAEKLIKEFDATTNTSRLSRRIRAHVKAALEYYFEQTPGYSQAQKALVNSVLAGETVIQEQWQA